MLRTSLCIALAAFLFGIAAVATRPAFAGTLAPDTLWSSRGLRVCGASGAQGTPALAADGAGGYFMVWEDSRANPDSSDLYAQHLLGDGTLAPGWPANGLALCQAPGHQSQPQLVLDGLGGILVSWEDDRFGTAKVYALHLTAAGATAAGWSAFGRELCAKPGVQRVPRMVGDGAGGAIVVWEDYRGGTPRIAAQHVQGNAQFAPGWADTALWIAPAIGGQVSPVLVTDGAGGAIAGWTDGRGGSPTGPDLFAQHFLGSGAPASGWPVAGLSVCSALQAQDKLAMAPDGAGGAFFAWSDPRDGTFFIYAQHLNANGKIAAGWQTDGIALAPLGAGQFDATVVTDGFNAAIIAWADLRGAGGDADLYAQRVDAAGVVAWGSDGLPVCTASGDQLAPRGVADGAGGLIVAWADARFGGDPRLFAQRLTSAGGIALGWPADGRAVADSNRVFAAGVVETDGTGGVVAAWSGEDLVSGGPDADVYAGRVAADGRVAARASALAVDALSDRVSLRWWTPAPGAIVDIERADGDGAWRERAVVSADGSGRVDWVDRDVLPGTRYGWRLRIAGETAGEVWATVPVRGFAIRSVAPQPAGESATLALALERGVPARLEVFDAAGRRRESRAIEGLGEAARVRLETSAWAPGVYLVRLTQAGRVTSARLVVAR